MTCDDESPTAATAGILTALREAGFTPTLLAERDRLYFRATSEDGRGRHVAFVGRFGIRSQLQAVRDLAKKCGLEPF